ncbi:hypothetical protein VFPPC_10338 [Pochonia chlamydosporia 170]|uniref:Uncharacterized protein n=1 Tax=Pochonia chlamydosporia 170 TaxID=1380566 RepID=A0A179EZK4_METCM|nr:hypothetical protein VFPPC_10338 [Pochonia chlamydosporia 170]OAQ58625.1 hypothetical protein VFPPC_10338 [Pochonia chlamydosporia 170]
MEDERATAPAMNEAGGVESSPIGPSNLSDTDGIQESEFEFDLERLLHDQPLDQDEEAYFPSPFSSAEDLLSQDLIQGSSSVEPDDVDRRNTLIQSIESEEPSFKMNEDDYAEMRLSLGISGQAGSVGHKKSVADIPSPTTPGTQIAQEAGTLVDQLESPLQGYRRRLGRNLVQTSNETPEESIKRPRSQRKRPYELLEQETAAILNDWNPATQIAARYTNETARKLRKSKAITTVPSEQKPKLDKAALITCTPWRVLPNARLEVLIRAKRKVVPASYENVDGAGLGFEELLEEEQALLVQGEVRGRPPEILARRVALLPRSLRIPFDLPQSELRDQEVDQSDEVGLEFDLAHQKRRRSVHHISRTELWKR